MVALRTFPALTFSHVADAAYVCSCGGTLLAAQRVSPNQPFSASKLDNSKLHFRCARAHQSGRGTLPTFGFSTSLMQHPFAGAAQFSLRNSIGRQSGRSNGVLMAFSNCIFAARSMDNSEADRVSLSCIYANGCFREGATIPIDEGVGARLLFCTGCLGQGFA